MHEFRSFGRAMRLTRERDPEFWNVVKEGTSVWHDYDGDEIYGDVAVDVVWVENVGWTMTPIEKAAHEPGIGAYDYASNAASYRHGDQIGSTRAITGEGSMGGQGGTGVPPAEVTGRIVYTAFGERVWSDGTVGTRYQYAGAWGYQSELYEDASGNLPFVHVGHRWYDPSTGRFLQRDPIGVAGGLNIYNYMENHPIADVDPHGLTPRLDMYFRYRDQLPPDERRALDLTTGIGVACAAAPWAVLAGGYAVAPAAGRIGASAAARISAFLAAASSHEGARGNLGRLCFVFRYRFKDGSLESLTANIIYRSTGSRIGIGFDPSKGWHWDRVGK